MLIVIDTDDLTSLVANAEQRGKIIAELKHFGRIVPPVPAALELRLAEEACERAKRDAIKPNPELEKIIAKNPEVIAAQQRLDALRAQLGAV